jgi:hypothetical protein
MKHDTQTVDFSRSFLTFRLDFAKKPPQTVSHKPPYSLNSARIQVVCRARLKETASGETQTFVMGASCKTERVGVERGIWTEPNADFVPVFSVDRFLNVKTFARAGTEVALYPPGSGTQSDRQVGDVAETFDALRIEVEEVPGEVLDTPSRIVEATLDNQPLVARTHIHQGRYQAILEYPIKTMNANERDWVYQTDTGPLLLPDFNAAPERVIETFQLAYAAFNCPEWVECVVRDRTPVGEGVEVYHYSRLERFEARNEVIQVR